MNSRTVMVCTICEQERVGVDGWFMLTENEWLDRLKVLAWNDTLAVREDVHCLCCVAHVQELVAHWMATDSLEYPFARLPFTRKRARRRRAAPLTGQSRAFDSPAGQVIGELAVDRESLRWVLRENPYSLITIMEPLLSALRQQHIQPELQCSPPVFCGVEQ